MVPTSSGSLNVDHAFRPDEFTIALLNILEDFADEKLRSKETQTAILNILEEAGDERRQLKNTQNAIFNILSDLQAEKSQLEAAIVERERVERALYDKNRELQENARDIVRSNSELQQFAYVASHDLQEPLRMVASFTQLLAKRYQHKLDKDANDFIRYAVDGATRMQTLISDLLTYSRVGMQEKPFELTNCEAILDRVIFTLKFAIADSGAVITHGFLPVLMADDTQLSQLFQNLLGNAIKFRGANPPRVHVSSERNANGWKISVQDNGIGISPEHRERIFQIFQRLHTKAEYPGTGIGLAICKKIVERHGGCLCVESTPEGGSIFSFTMCNSGEREIL